MDPYRILKPIFFSLSAENAHGLAMKGLRLSDSLPGFSGLLNSISKDPVFEKPVELFGLRFRNPVGLGAGFDKDARYVDQLAKLGFGFIEIGTVTPRSQPGNPKPRLFRIPGDQALINRMGFNNEGVESCAKRLEKRKSNVILGGNIGKNKSTPNESALDDYLECFKALEPFVDYFTVNVSSPNTPGLRELQERPFLSQLFRELAKLQKPPKEKPILLKIAPDLDEGQLEDIVSLCIELGVSGIIATNTTINRNLESISEKRIEELGAGGLSGKPLMEMSTHVVRRINELSKGALPVIASGGIFTSDDVKKKLDAGAKLVQVYTGFIYEGPYFVKKLLKNI